MPGVTSKTNSAKLRSSSATPTCGTINLNGGSSPLPIPDKSAYWVPELFREKAKMNQMPVDTALVYYRDEGLNPADVSAFPQDLVMVAGYPKAKDTDYRSPETVEWSCVSAKTAQEHEEQFGTTIPDWCDKTNQAGDDYYLRLIVYFPNCFVPAPDTNGNGQYDDNDSHGRYVPQAVSYAPGTAATGDNALCPQGSVTIPQVQVGFRWKLKNQSLPDYQNDIKKWDLTQLTLDSDDVNMGAEGVTGSHGATAHADFMSGWATSGLLSLISVCFHGGANAPQKCGNIGDDEGDG